MSDDKPLSMQKIREDYAYSSYHDKTMPYRFEQFNQALAAHDAEVAAKARREALEDVRALFYDPQADYYGELRVKFEALFDAPSAPGTTS